MLLASLYAPDGGWLKRRSGALVAGGSLATLDTPAFAPATGYISFFTLGLYIGGLVLMSFGGQREPGLLNREDYPQITQITRNNAVSGNPEWKPKQKERGQARGPGGSPRWWWKTTFLP